MKMLSKFLIYCNHNIFIKCNCTKCKCIYNHCQLVLFSNDPWDLQSSAETLCRWNGKLVANLFRIAYYVLNFVRISYKFCVRYNKNILDYFFIGHSVYCNANWGLWGPWNVIYFQFCLSQSITKSGKKDVGVPLRNANLHTVSDRGVQVYPYPRVYPVLP